MEPTALLKEAKMICVLIIGYAPDAVDFGDPAVPPGLNAAIIRDGIEKDLQMMRDRGWKAEYLPIRPNGSLRRDIVERLGDQTYDCIVIGAGVRLTTRRIPEFEQVLAAIRKVSPTTPIAFNSGPNSSVDAVGRWLGG
jgi:hypothetical protein